LFSKSDTTLLFSKSDTTLLFSKSDTTLLFSKSDTTLLFSKRENRNEQRKEEEKLPGGESANWRRLAPFAVRRGSVELLNASHSFKFLIWQG
jgi:hypothetical protein